MDKKKTLSIMSGISLFCLLLILLGINNIYGIKDSNYIEGMVISVNDDLVMLQDKNNAIYTFNAKGIDSCYSGNVVLKYMGVINKNMEIQDVDVTGCEVITVSNLDNVSYDWQDNGMFRDYYKLAYNKVKTMSLDEKIAQLLLVRYPENNGLNILKKYQFGGYLFFERDFTNKTKKQVKEMISSLQEIADIPILVAVDEEGGKVVRISSNPNLSSKRFDSPSTLYKLGGFSLIKNDTINKSKLLKELGINLNLAPVVDVVSDSGAYMYDRSLQEDAELTSEYAKVVIESSKGTGVSYVLKHFPGYGNNSDTHGGKVYDNRSYDEIFAIDLPPFEEGIKAGAEAVLVGHNMVIGIDGNNPASLSPVIHNLLRNELNFSGVIISDDLSMRAVSDIEDTAVKAILAGNDLIISTNYSEDIKSIDEAIGMGILTEEMIDKVATRVIAWKYYKGLLMINQK